MKKNRLRSDTHASRQGVVTLTDDFSVILRGVEVRVGATTLGVLRRTSSATVAPLADSICPIPYSLS